jgi:hypothetical protein
MLIILLVSAVALPTIIPAISHREVSEAARILQAGLVQGRDMAINNNAPAGIRLLPDPAFPPQQVTIGGVPQIDATTILASNRFVPIELAPDYSEGMVTPVTFGQANADMMGFGLANPALYFQYPAQKGGGFYPAGTDRMLHLEQAVNNYATTPPTPNPPTSWYWNVRIGDKVQVDNSGIYYTVVGPMNVFNSELFVNVGPPGTTPPVLHSVTIGGTTYNSNPEILFLVNGLDDDTDGYVDNGFDGVDNDGDGIVDRAPDFTIANYYEWREAERWQSRIRNFGSSAEYAYTITRRPIVSPGSREILLPSNVVVDLTTWNANWFTTTFKATTGVTYVSERSRLPVDSINGTVDVLLNPNGTVVPTTAYSSPSSFGMDSSFYHFWLAERTDLYAPPNVKNPPATGVLYLLPQVPNANTAAGDTRALKGERRLVTLYTRTGQIVVNQPETFDGNIPGLSFLAPQQGLRGDTR